LESKNRRNENNDFYTGTRETAELLCHIPRSHWRVRLQSEELTASARAYRSMPVAPFFVGISQNVSKAAELKNGPL